VTGFGPFASHSVNASWVAVREMERSGGLGPGINLVTVEVPVSYDIVTELIPQLWKIHKPVVSTLFQVAFF
jgi:pyroglutamyl-peptidase